MRTRSRLSGWAFGSLLFGLAGCSNGGATNNAFANPEGDIGTSAVPTNHTVQVGAGAFSPARLTIRPGDSVTWSWAESGHSVTSGIGVADDKFCSPTNANCAAGTLSSAGAIYRHTFAAPGEYPYFCVAHFSEGMTGMINVVP